MRSVISTISTQIENLEKDSQVDEEHEEISSETSDSEVNIPPTLINHGLISDWRMNLETYERFWPKLSY